MTPCALPKKAFRPYCSLSKCRKRRQRTHRKPCRHRVRGRARILAVGMGFADDLSKANQGKPYCSLAAKQSISTWLWPLASGAGSKCCSLQGPQVIYPGIRRVPCCQGGLWWPSLHSASCPCLTSCQSETSFKGTWSILQRPGRTTAWHIARVTGEREAQKRNLGKERSKMF